MNHDTYFRGPSDHHTGLRTIRDSRDAYGTRYQKAETGHWFWPVMSFAAFITILLLFIGLSINVAFAQAPEIYDAQTGKYLGNMSANTLDPNSINNPLGRYGNPLSPDSVRNPLGTYGNPLSNSSITNPFATNPPVLIVPGRAPRW